MSSAPPSKIEPLRQRRCPPGPAPVHEDADTADLGTWERLKPARGVALGLAVALVFWALVGAAVAVLR